ncbi:MAG: cupredoxin domain-containing protein [Acidobacteriota bacterium]
MRVLPLAFGALVLVAATAGALVAGGQSSAPAPVTVHVAAERFSFTPSEIRATVGTPLTISLTSDDTAHGFRILGTDINVEIPKRSRGAVAVTFTPTEAGTYTFECSKLCGAGHSFMRGEIVVAAPASERP